MEDYDDFMQDQEDFMQDPDYIENPEEYRKIAALIKGMYLSEHIDRFAFGRLTLNNIINEEIEREMNLNYDDFYGPEEKKNPISEDFDLGSW